MMSNNDIENNVIEMKTKKEQIMKTSEMKTEVRTEYHDNGQKEDEVTYKDGKEEGLWTHWFENGQKFDFNTNSNNKELVNTTNK